MGFPQIHGPDASVSTIVLAMVAPRWEWALSMRNSNCLSFLFTKYFEVAIRESADCFHSGATL